MHNDTPAPPEQDLLLRSLIHADVDIAALEQKLGVRLERVATWAMDPATHEMVEGLLCWLNMQAQIAINGSRLAAVSRLCQLALQEGNAESARKACEDLLSANLMKEHERAMQYRRRDGDGAASFPPAMITAMQHALTAIGTEEGLDED
ncbi:MAG: hypothetical protein GC162_16780 [Planctomycetes bacterium]|nr:hypothetical protein [Planctomycetota bacterium]